MRRDTVLTTRNEFIIDFCFQLFDDGEKKKDRRRSRADITA